MNLIGSLIRRLGINVGNSSDSIHQTARNSSGVVQAGRDVNVYPDSQSKESYPKIGEAFFSASGLTLSVHDFRAGGDRADRRYLASLATKHVALFVAALRDADYVSFGIRDNQGIVDIPCTVTVPEGSYEGTVTFIEVGQRESSFWDCVAGSPCLSGHRDIILFQLSLPRARTIRHSSEASPRENGEQESRAPSPQKASRRPVPGFLLMDKFLANGKKTPRCAPFDNYNDPVGPLSPVANAQSPS